MIGLFLGALFVTFINWLCYRRLVKDYSKKSRKRPEPSILTEVDT